MKRTLLFLAIVCIASVGCQSRNQMASNSCRSCGPMGGGLLAADRANAEADRVPQIPHDFYRQTQPSGPPTASVGYPYYTTRAPRDFLSSNPGSIGP